MNSKRSKNKIFISGACGFVGKFLVEKLLETTDCKLILNCRNNENHEFHSNRIIYSCVNLNDIAAIEHILQIYKPDTIIHLAAMARLGAGEKEPDVAFQTNVLATNQLIRLSILNQIKTFVFVSSDLARPPISVVGITKYLSEAAIQQLKKENLRILSIRLPNVAYSSGSVHLIFERQIKESKSLTITHEKMTRRFVSGEEAASFILFALNNGKNKDIFVVDKKPEKIIALAEKMIKSSGKPLKIEIIGMRAGEKLEEETYEKDGLEPTDMKNLALLTKKPFSKIEINKVKMSLVSKPGFTLLKELDLL